MHGNTRDLRNSDQGEEEVDSGKPMMMAMSVSFYPVTDLSASDKETASIGDYLQDVPGLDDEAPSRPDKASAGQGEVLRKGQFLGRSSQIGNASQDESPLSTLRVSQR